MLFMFMFIILFNHHRTIFKQPSLQVSSTCQSSQIWNRAAFKTTIRLTPGLPYLRREMVEMKILKVW